MNQLCMQMLHDGYCLTVEPHHKVELMQDDARLDAVGLTPMLFAASYLADAIQRNYPEASATFIQAQGLMKMRLVGAHIENSSGFKLVSQTKSNQVHHS